MTRKKRWMQSVIDASTQDIPALPFSRQARRNGGLKARHTAPMLLRSA